MANLGIDEFLEYDTRSGRHKVKRWKEAGSVGLYLHRKAEFHTAWNHQFYELVEVEKDGDKVPSVFSRTFNCHESDMVCKAANFRDRKTGRREKPPVICPMDLMIERVFELVQTDVIPWTAPIFAWEGASAKHNVTLHAGGIYGAFGKKLDKEERRDLRKAHVDIDDAWKQRLGVKLNWVFVGVSDPKEGVLVFVESEQLGQKLKQAMKDKRERLVEAKKDPGLFNPHEHPYPFRWVYDKNAVDKKDAFTVVALDSEPSGEVFDLITNGDIPDLGPHIDKGNCAWLYRQMKQALVLEGDHINLDEIFQPAFDAGLMDDAEGDDEDDDEDDDDVPFKVEDKASTSAAKPAAKQAAAPAEPDKYDCDHCFARGVIPENAVECPSCGAEYDKDSRLTARPCVDCKELVQLKGGPNYICPKCGVVHKETPGKDPIDPEEDVMLWEVVSRPPPVEEVPPATTPKPKRTRKVKEAAPEVAPTAEPPTAASTPPADEQVGWSE